MAAAIAERQFLAEVDHPQHRQDPQLRRARRRRLHRDGVRGRPVAQGAAPAERRRHGRSAARRQAIAYIARDPARPSATCTRTGLLYCDFKPDNVIQSEEQLKLIDLGGRPPHRRRHERSLRHGRLPGARGAGAGRVGLVGSLHGRRGPWRCSASTSAASRTSARYATSLPAGLGRGRLRALRVVLLVHDQGDRPRPGGTLRVGRRDGRPALRRPARGRRPATGPTPPSDAQHAVHRRAPGRPRRSRVAQPAAPHGRPASIPGPPSSPAWPPPSADQLVAALRAAPPSPEIQFRLVPRAPRGRRPRQAAGEVLDRIDARPVTTGGPPGGSGVTELAAGDPTAGPRPVRRRWPGHCPASWPPSWPWRSPPSGLARQTTPVAGARRPLAEAARYYDIVARTDPTYASASFGLARVRLTPRRPRRSDRRPRRGSRPARVSSHRRPDRPVPGPVHHLDGQRPEVDDLVARRTRRAARRRALDAGAGRFDLRCRAVLDLVESGAAPADATSASAGAPLVEPTSARRLEQTYRALATARPRRRTDRADRRGQPIPAEDARVRPPDAPACDAPVSSPTTVLRGVRPGPAGRPREDAGARPRTNRTGRAAAPGPSRSLRRRRPPRPPGARPRHGRGRVGPRSATPHNEDAFALASRGGRHAVVVCDGVSTTSHPDGRVARRPAPPCRPRSRRSTSPTGPTRNGPASLLVRAIGEAQRAVAAVGPVDSDPEQLDVPSTTIVAAMVDAGSGRRRPRRRQSGLLAARCAEESRRADDRRLLGRGWRSPRASHPTGPYADPQGPRHHPVAGRRRRRCGPDRRRRRPSNGRETSSSCAPTACGTTSSPDELLAVAGADLARAPPLDAGPAPGRRRAGRRRPGQRHGRRHPDPTRRATEHDRGVADHGDFSARVLPERVPARRRDRGRTPSSRSRHRAPASAAERPVTDDGPLAGPRSS